VKRKKELSQLLFLFYKNGAVEFYAALSVWVPEQWGEQAIFCQIAYIR
jgi:hypothetical protein